MISLPTIVLLFFSGVALLLISSKLLIEVTESLAIRWSLSPLFISMILIALGTNLPELSVLFSSLMQGDPSLTLGNAVGSSINNITLIFGLALLIRSPRIGTTKTQKNNILLIILVSTLATLEMLAIPQQIKGVILLLFLMVFFWYEYHLAKNGRWHEDKNFFKAISLKTKKKIQGGSILVSALIIVASLIGLLVGSGFVVRAVEGLSILFSISTGLLGVTLVAVTTTLPELMTTIMAGIKKEDKVIVGNLVGSNVYNLSLLVAIIYLSPFSIKIHKLNLLFLVISTGLFGLIVLIYKGKRVPRYWGMITIALFALFVLVSFAYR